MVKTRIGFLFNHDQVHQVAHSLPIAFALMRQLDELDITIAVTSHRLRMEVELLIARFAPDLAPPVVTLHCGRSSSRLMIAMLDGIVPVAKLALYRDNLAFFRGLDALVVAEKTSALLKTRYGLNHLKLIHTRHGAGDRAIGFNKASANFDLVLVSGSKIRDRLIAEAGVYPSQLAVVGYPKFDFVAAGSRPSLLMQRNGRKTVLYNPHVSPHLSSWYRDGLKVLEFFYRSTEYNLIFAPHVMLFERPFAITVDKLSFRRTGHIPNHYLAASNIHVDLGSRACTDMTYALAADLYLGDVSSQLYEFLLRPRPCIFLNSHGVEHASNPNYAHWKSGEVIRSVTQLGPALDNAWVHHGDYLEAQQTLFSQSIDLTDQPSSERAATAIVAFLNRQAAAPEQIAA
jgi:hypothetical protein